MAEAHAEQFFGADCCVGGLALGGAEPGWRPRPVPSGAEAGPHGAEDGRNLFLGQLLDQAAQFLAFGAHGMSVRAQPWSWRPVGKAVWNGNLRLITALMINKRQAESR